MYIINNVDDSLDPVPSLGKCLFRNSVALPETSQTVPRILMFGCLCGLPPTIQRQQHTNRTPYHKA